MDFHLIIWLHLYFKLSEKKKNYYCNLLISFYLKTLECSLINLYNSNAKQIFIVHKKNIFMINVKPKFTIFLYFYI